MMDWRVHTSFDWQMDMTRLAIYRNIGDRVEVIIGFTDSGDAIVKSFEANQVIDWRGFSLPRDVLPAIAEHVKPGPAEGEMARVTEALAVERGRVDSVLAAFTGRVGEGNQ